MKLTSSVSRFQTFQQSVTEIKQCLMECTKKEIECEKNVFQFNRVIKVETKKENKNSILMIADRSKNSECYL